jgi:hypothetical protein
MHRTQRELFVMQNPKITEIENRFKDRIKRVSAFSNLVNVVVFSPEEFGNYVGTLTEIFEHKTASTAKFVSFAMFDDFGCVVATEELPVQVPDMPKK